MKLILTSSTHIHINVITVEMSHADVLLLFLFLLSDMVNMDSCIEMNETRNFYHGGYKN